MAGVTRRESRGGSLCHVAWVETCCSAEILEVVRSAVAAVMVLSGRGPRKIGGFVSFRTADLNTADPSGKGMTARW